MSTTSRKTGFVRLVLLFIVPAVAVLVLLNWYVSNQRFVTTDNAYVKANIIAISPSIDGRVTSIAVKDNLRVEAGDELFRLDDRPYTIALARAQARLNTVGYQVDSMRAQYAQIGAEIENAEERVKFLERKRRREEDLRSQGLGTAAKIDELEYSVIEAKQSVLALRQQARQALADLGGEIDLPTEQHPKFREALAAQEEAQLFLDYTVVRAPASGTISRMTLQAGEWLEAGDPVFSLIETGDLWVEANLKETQLTHVAVGQAVDFEVDAYPGRRWRGEVASISSATGSEFLVLPAQNATGNWVKVVQRVPVRIRIHDHSDAPSMRAGMTVKASIDTRRERAVWAFVRDAVAAIGGP